jgi:hypothetical protein
MNIVERLRGHGMCAGAGIGEDCEEAAALIEEAREALAPFADLGSVWSKSGPCDDSPWTTRPDDTRLTVGADHIGWNHVTVGDLRRAFVTLAKLTPSGKGE